MHQPVGAALRVAFERQDLPIRKSRTTLMRLFRPALPMALARSECQADQCVCGYECVDRAAENESNIDFVPSA